MLHFQSVDGLAYLFYNRVQLVNCIAIRSCFATKVIEDVNTVQKRNFTQNFITDI